MLGRSLDELGETLTWRDLWVLTRHWRVTPGFALCSSIKGADLWPQHEQILMELVDQMNVLIYLTKRDKHAKKPKRMKRPWEKGDEQKFGADPIPISEFDDWWDAQEEARQSGAG